MIHGTPFWLTLLSSTAVRHVSEVLNVRARKHQQPSRDCPLAGLWRRLRSARAELTTRWLNEIAARVSIERHRLFLGEELLDHVPLLIDISTARAEQTSIPRVK